MRPEFQPLSCEGTAGPAEPLEQKAHSLSGADGGSSELLRTHPLPLLGSLWCSQERSRPENGLLICVWGEGSGHVRR